MTATKIERLIKIISRESNLILVIFSTLTSTSLVLYLCQDLLFIVYICFGAPAFDGLVEWIWARIHSSPVQKDHWVTKIRASIKLMLMIDNDNIRILVLMICSLTSVIGLSDIRIYALLTLWYPTPVCNGKFELRGYSIGRLTFPPAAISQSIYQFKAYNITIYNYQPIQRKSNRTPVLWAFSLSWPSLWTNLYQWCRKKICGLSLQPLTPIALPTLGDVPLFCGLFGEHMRLQLMALWSMPSQPRESGEFCSWYGASEWQSPNKGENGDK